MLSSKKSATTTNPFTVQLLNIGGGITHLDSHNTMTDENKQEIKFDYLWNGYRNLLQESWKLELKIYDKSMAIADS